MSTVVSIKIPNYYGHYYWDHNFGKLPYFGGVGEGGRGVHRLLPVKRYQVHSCTFLAACLCWWQASIIFAILDADKSDELKIDEFVQPGCVKHC